ncbi:putative IstB-like ATPase [Streptomyces bingchenggensis BCW-1]|uniref:Putative IstB-like ATPase n=1 Tax=Streptomyces bingchenggensis (strain BCW-1) TaxID=749414 RepID=D7BSY1_STRBB|nr:putative IstB-like ATPase [Streptomyces bingchenggensis BCW-1]
MFLAQRRRRIQAVGDSGTGKSHMLIVLGTEAAMKGYRVSHTPSFIKSSCVVPPAR